MLGRWVLCGVVGLLMVGCTSSAIDSDASAASSTTEVREPASDVLFAPVVKVGPPPCDGEFFTHDDECLLLGRNRLDRSVVESAFTGAQSAGDFVVYPLLSEGGATKFNALAAACFYQRPDCPTGRLAIMSDGEVISAPKINAPSFERDRLVIAGNLREAEATSIAERLKGEG